MGKHNTQTVIQVRGTYEIKSWDEKTWDGKNWDEQPGRKLTHARVTQTFHGGIEGDGQCQFLMSYDDEKATFIGLQHISGKIGDRSGTCVLEVNGVFENGAASSTWSVIPGSGTGDLAGLHGKGSSVAHEGMTQSYTLDYLFK